MQKIIFYSVSAALALSGALVTSYTEFDTIGGFCVGFGLSLFLISFSVKKSPDDTTN